MVEAYFDESGSHNGSPVLCVAGYIIEKGMCVILESEWGEMLAEFNLPFFRMSACAHGTKPFKELTKDQCIEVEKRAIAIIRQRIVAGIAVTVVPQRYDAIVPQSAESGSAY